MSIPAEFLKEIAEYCREAGISEWAFSNAVMNDGKFVRRIRAGSGLNTSTLEKVRLYIATQRKAATQAAKRAERKAAKKAAP